VISSIPSTIVRPLQDRGTPAGPSLSGIRFAPRRSGRRGDPTKGVFGGSPDLDYVILNEISLRLHQKRYESLHRRAPAWVVDRDN